MNLWIKTDVKSAACGYTFAVGLTRANNTADILDLCENIVVGKAKYFTSDKYVQYTIPKNLLGNVFEIKATDNVNLLEDIMNLYVLGDSAPYGRLNYKFVLK